ncbi:MAG: glycoside hydrolase family 65 protein [Gemmatimonadota bacterium]|nr:MAG: glycoside hydrolase family 65 protein [Gemmatimonadota bacterium]
MLTREIQYLPDHVYPTDEWRLLENRYYPRLLPQVETLFSTSNGFLGIRGCHEEGCPVYQSGTFVNGFHETWPIVYGERAFGFAKTGQTIVNVPDAKIVKLYVDDEPLDVSKVNLPSYERVLDMRSGLVQREIVWEKHSGKQILVESRRLVSFVHRHVAAISYQVTLLNADAPIVLSSELVHDQELPEADGDPRGTRAFGRRVLLPQGHYTSDRRVVLSYITCSSKMTLACGIDHVIDTELPYTCKSTCDADLGRILVSVDGKKGQTVRLTKFMTYHVSRSAPAAELCERADRALDRVVASGFDALAQEQRLYLEDFWARSDVCVTGDSAVQQVLRFNLFHICQATARAESVGIPAKGLTGHGYEGHYFWDTEIYVLPFLIYTAPQIARNVLRFRYGMLGKARQRAREVNQRGALFPWRTINGEEASAYYAAGTAQYHINADIIYALRKYVEVTGDVEFLYQEGAEMLVETARLWADLGFYSARKGGKFCISGVTGPDEYNTVQDNNTYTNLMARENLWYAASTIEWIRQNRPDRFKGLAYETELAVDEIAEWKRAADNMYICVDQESGIHMQDDDFLEKEPWDFDGTPPDKYPLLLHFHPLVIYRHQVIKQADIVLAMFLLGDEFSLEQKRRNFDFYDPLTTGDSSLSVSIQSILAFELGYLDKAREYATYALMMDMADVAANVEHGCHIASMGGTWMATVYGTAGLRDYDGCISFNPRLGRRVDQMSFNLMIRGQRLSVAIDQLKDEATYLLTEGSGLTIEHQGSELHLKPGQPITQAIRGSK